MEYNKARVIQAIVNEVIEWRVYYDQELNARFAQYNQATSFADYLNKKNNETNNDPVNPQQVR
jgi:hypothetical protein